MSSHETNKWTRTATICSSSLITSHQSSACPPVKFSWGKIGIYMGRYIQHRWRKIFEIGGGTCSLVPWWLPDFISQLWRKDSGPSADTYLDTEQRTCCQPAAFLSRRTCITLSTYVYTSFVSHLVLAVDKMPMRTLLFNHLLYWSHIGWACRHHYETKSTLRTNRVHHFRSMTYM